MDALRRRLTTAVRRLRDQRGFGLIELVIALSMLAVAMVSLSAVFVSGNVVFRRAGQQDAAAALADRMLERYRAIRWNDIALSSQLVSATDSHYLGGDGSPLGGSLSSDITETNGATSATSCTGTDQNALPLTCIPARTIPDTSASHPEVAPDHKSYRVDSYVTWGCPDGSTPDSTTGCGGSLFARVKVVTVVIRDATSLDASVYKTSAAFDRLGGGSMPAVTNMSSTTVSTSTTGTTGTSAGAVPDAPTSVWLASGGGSGGTWVNASNVTSANIDVQLPSTSLGTDRVFLRADDGSGLHTVTAQGSGIPGGGTLAFTNLNLQALNDGTLTLTAYTENGSGDSATVTGSASKDTVAPDAPTSVALQNGTGDGSWINSATVTGAYATVGLDANWASTDTVKVAFGDGTNTTSAASATPSGTAGLATSVADGPVNTSTLSDGTGNITAKAWVTDTAGNSSATLTSSTYSKDVVAPSVSSISLANGGGTGNAYVNNANKAGINVDVALPSGSKASDSVKLVAKDAGNAHTVTIGTKSGTGGSGTLHYTGADLSTLNDGTITFTVTDTDTAGNSSTTTKTVTKDVVAPSAPALLKLSYSDKTNGTADQIVGAAGAVEAGATVTAGAYSTTAAADGSFTLVVAAIAGSNASPKPYTYSLTATDAAGNTSLPTVLAGSDKK